MRCLQGGTYLVARVFCHVPHTGRQLPRAMSEQWPSLERLLRGKAPGLSPSLAHTALWLAEHLPEVAWRTVDEIAAAARVSPASVVRCLQQVGFDGYNGFRRTVQQGLPASELVWELTRDHAPVTAQASVVGRVIQQEVENLGRLEQLAGQDMQDLARDLAASRTSVFLGSITSAPFAAHAATELNILLGKVRHFDPATGEAWLFVRDAQPDDVVVGICFPRYAEATLKLLRAVKNKVRGVWLLTDEIGPRDSEDIGRLVRLPVTSHGSFGSKASLVALVEILTELLADLAPDPVLGNVDEADEIWRGAKFLNMHAAKPPHGTGRPAAGGRSGPRDRRPPPKGDRDS